MRSRWVFLFASSLGLFGLLFGKPDVPIVDTHVHLWDLKRPAGLGWIAKDNETLYRNFLPEHHAPIARANGVRAVVLVQAGQSLPDNQWNLDLTARDKDLYRGLVGNLSEVIGTDRFQPLFDKLCQDRRYVGYRLSGRYQEKLTEAFFRDLERTAEKRRTVDFLCGKYSLQDVEAIATRLPGLKIIIDHFGKRPLGRRAFRSAMGQAVQVVGRKAQRLLQGLRSLRTGEAPTRSQEGFFLPAHTRACL